MAENKEFDSIFDKIVSSKIVKERIGTENVAEIKEITEEATQYIKDKSQDIVAAGDTFVNFLKSKSEASMTESAMNLYNSIKNNNNVSNIGDTIDKIVEKAGNTAEFLVDALDKAAGVANSVANSILNDISGFLKYIPASSTFGKALKKIAIAAVDNMKDYQDGVSETTFGSYMNDSWVGLSSSEQSSFLDYFAKNKNRYKITVMNTTPLDPGETRNALFGSMILGTPFLYNSQSDPGNRAFINSIVKDARYISFTPGMPKYNGSQTEQKDNDNILNQTKTPESMMSYLLKNGLDSEFSSKDKRYYTFEAKYSEYFAYLEAMLNPIWLKLGLGTKGNNEFSIFSFFKIKSGSGDGGIDPSGAQQLLERYNSPIGFFCDPSGAVSESLDASTTSFGSDLASQANANSDTYQKINYVTGMGTGSNLRNIARKAGIGYTTAQQIGSLVSENMQHAKSGYQKGKDLFQNVSGTKGKVLRGVGAVAGLASGAALDLVRIQGTEDLGSMVQSIGVANGMKVMYPELWSNSSYSKNINVNFSFISPYGDPLSIFKYVYVPFCALLCLGMPRQAAENGYVSPFFVRADIPGLISSDLALISSITWTKGGSANLWTKDGLPRAMDVNITLSDLYPYLSMTKRFSYLSANPSYTVFLDNMAGLCALQSNTDDPLNEYFNRLLSRISGDVDGNGLWNEFNSTKKTAISNSYDKARASISGSLSPSSIGWL